ncbi:MULTISPECIES: DMT family transporter [Metallosphaera]|uniref:DMT family transporter n=1 Tax=Metallosphaera TaxID=41980 RepID=UPI001F05F9CD|nr:DMT family transporter [Metallosphaera sedula]MCH1770104.1 DMT family transporter [Metallosphaera sedula]MCP6728062.1 DMT family transporter [Metallosphaera sedula]
MKLSRAFYDLVGASVLWGTIGIAVQEAYRFGANSLGIVLFRTLFSCLILFYQGNRKILLRWESIAMGLIAGTFYEIYAFTIILDGAPLSSFLLYTAPLFVILFSYALFKEELNLRKVIGSFIVIVALYLDYLGTPTPVELIWGILSGVSYAGLISYSKFLQLRGFSGWDVLSAQSVWSLPLSLVVSLPFSRSISVGSVAGGLYMAILGTIIPYYLFYRGIKLMDSAIATVISALEPVVTTLLAYPLLGQTLTPLQILSASMILGSSIWLSLSR